MKDLNIIVYTMKGCHHCTNFKEMLVNEGIEFFDRDIDEYQQEYDMYCEVAENDLIPALLIIEGDDSNDDRKTFIYAPDRNYNELTEALELINNHRRNVGII
jgi:glutaredoxin